MVWHGGVPTDVVLEQDLTYSLTCRRQEVN